MFRRDPERFWHFYGDRFQTLEHKQPNRAHEALAELEQAGLLDAVITQNIDRLHARAGTRELIEVHGTIDHSSCLRCGGQLPAGRRARPQRADAEAIPRCDCGSPLKPDVVLFGEYLPVDALRRAEELAAGADLLLCVGSSLEVYPVAQLPAIDARRRRPDRRSSPRARRRSTAAPRSAAAATSSHELDAVIEALGLDDQALATARARSAASIRASVNSTACALASTVSGPASAA